MPIFVSAEEGVLHLQTHSTSYIMKVLPSGHLAHIYWGRRLRGAEVARRLRLVDRAFSPNPVPVTPGLSLDTLPQEYPAYGNSDFREPAIQVQAADGSTITDLRYAGHRIVPGKPKLEGLPATYVEDKAEAETLEVDLFDDLIGLRVTLLYTVFPQYDVVTRSARLTNEGTSPCTILRALSMSVDFPAADFDFLQLSGAWARERTPLRRPLTLGTVSVESRRGASSHQHNPFVALMAKDAGEEHGDVYAVNLVYSGNFRAFCEVDQFATARLAIGINPFDFAWRLEPGECFQTPEAVMVYSAQGLGHLSRTYHRLYRERLARGKHRDAERPILINNWEATYFDFNEEKILALAQTASRLGIELFVLDDGWFGKRNDDRSSLGDWFVNRDKLPGGLARLADAIHGMGMKFGLWVEPEMVSPDSELYRQHPDWCLHVPGRGRSEGRNQLVLDFSRPDVCDAVLEMISNVLRSARIDYVKWDMNRHMTEVGSALLPPERQRETAHRYMLGLYRVLEEMTARFPDVLFESCSGGGGRFDPGMLYYMPQTWTSDNTDAISRLTIQYGTSLAYPAVSMGAHVSAVPNHQVHRITPIHTRGLVAMAGNFGYELNLNALSDEELAAIRDQVAWYKSIRRIVQFGDLYRLTSPLVPGGAAAAPLPGEGGPWAWLYVTPKKDQAVVTLVQVLNTPNPPLRVLKLRGLDPSAAYWVKVFDRDEVEVYQGDELMYAGLPVPPLWGDFQAVQWHLRRV
ncbi:alpha-galactosidase [Alicyclobacillus cellulosilyticus]|uniref:Alpha-galactosidase n=1 Tax=Alicyclobacillus cellulosilyticus TaxID=1003997 RepID=A0A917JZY7_9BACL|nr:alpha-galactosidase [Alicyclobacillus cellulosilyticus]GGI95368.1 alpha-galactosidase [Alicyclobacillus cellulosilyticus]